MRVVGLPWYRGDTVISIIGQGYMQFTPLQLASGVATLAMHGQRQSPHLLRNAAGPTPEAIGLHDGSAWETVIHAMQKVITSAEGTGALHFGQPAEYSVAGKTGTAQVYSIKRRDIHAAREDQSKLPQRLRDNSLFAGFAPVEHPQIALAVIAENDDIAASRIARQVLDSYLLPSQQRIVPPLAPPENADIAAAPAKRGG